MANLDIPICVYFIIISGPLRRNCPDADELGPRETRQKKDNVSRAAKPQLNKSVGSPQRGQPPRIEVENVQNCFDMSFQSSVLMECARSIQLLPFVAANLSKMYSHLQTEVWAPLPL